MARKHMKMQDLERGDRCRARNDPFLHSRGIAAAAGARRAGTSPGTIASFVGADRVDQGASAEALPSAAGHQGDRRERRRAVARRGEGPARARRQALPRGRRWNRDAAERLTAVARRTGLKGAEIRQLADTGLVEIETRDGDQWLDDAGIRIVELWAKVREAGFTTELGFVPENMRLYVDFVRWLAREELRTFSHGVAGRVDLETSIQMAESGVNLINQIIALFRKATILRFIAAGNLADREDPRPSERAASGSREDSR